MIYEEGEYYFTKCNECCTHVKGMYGAMDINMGDFGKNDKAMGTH